MEVNLLHIFFILILTALSSLPWISHFCIIHPQILEIARLLMFTITVLWSYWDLLYSFSPILLSDQNPVMGLLAPILLLVVFYPYILLWQFVHVFLMSLFQNAVNLVLNTCEQRVNPQSCKPFVYNNVSLELVFKERSRKPPSNNYHLQA